MIIYYTNSLQKKTTDDYELFDAQIIIKFFKLK